MLAAALLAVAGCANDPTPDEQLRVSAQAVDQARAVGATEQSPTFALAEDKLARARTDVLAQRNRDARQRAEQAELDARLAEAQVLTQKSDELLAVAQARVKRLQKQLAVQP